MSLLGLDVIRTGGKQKELLFFFMLSLDLEQKSICFSSSNTCWLFGLFELCGWEGGRTENSVYEVCSGGLAPFSMCTEIPVWRSQLQALVRS
jgi:hypothetical protein